ncbi:MAG TPA: fluoride efflux transporter CrcB [Myxococcota bacterium]|nr:fluoride efflux transporter CrcB [Myxococcota bacterium]
MDRLAWVCLGSALGGGARYLVSLAALNALGTSFPWGTLFVNVVGSYLIGLIMHVSLETTLISPALRLFLTTGVMGGFTTYSAFNYETLKLVSDGDWPRAGLNVAVTLVVCLAAGVLGVGSARSLVLAFGRS